MNKIVILIALAFVYSCVDSSSKNENTKHAKTIILNVDKKAEVLNIEIPDIDSITDLNNLKEIYQGAIKNIKNSLDNIESKTIHVTMNNIPNTPVTIWYNKDNLVKIDYGVADDSGEITDVFTYYYDNDKVWLIDAIFAKYIFKNDKLIYWVNENWKEVDNVSLKDFKNSEKISISHSKELISLFE